MDALDSLLDFAALMSTSSAMTLVQESNNSDLSAQSTQISDAHSTITAPAQLFQARGRMEHHSPQLNSSVHSLPQSENPIATSSKAQADSIDRHPIDWIPTPPLLQGLPAQGQYPLMPESSRLPAYEACALDYRDIPYGCLPSERCTCNYSSRLSRCHQHGSMAPSLSNDQHVLLDQYGPELQVCQQLPADGFCGEACVLGQQLPLHRFFIEDSRESVAWHSMVLQYATLDMVMDTSTLIVW